MRNFHLTQEQLIELRAAHRAERNRRAAYKINAVILLGSGWKLREVKEALLLDEETLRSYVDKYQMGGLPELMASNYQGRVALIDNVQQQQLTDALEQDIYLTTQAVIEWVSEEFGVTYSQSGMRDLLHRLGYEYKKPKLVPGNPDRDAQEEFVEFYEQFIEEKSQDEEVLFVDAVHPEHNAQAAYGWIKRGQERPIKTNSGRQRLNLHGAINIESMEMTVIESATVNKDSTLELLEVIRQKYVGSKAIHIILDNARYHYSVEVQNYLKEAPEINLVFLPAYSPELNLIERVWRFFKKKVTHNKYYKNIKDFREAAIKFFRDIDRYTSDLRDLLGGGFHGFP